MSHRQRVYSYKWYLDRKYWGMLLGNPWLSSRMCWDSTLYFGASSMHNYITKVFSWIPYAFCLMPLFTFWNVGFDYLILILGWFSYLPNDWRKSKWAKPSWPHEGKGTEGYLKCCKELFCQCGHTIIIFLQLSPKKKYSTFQLLKGVYKQYFAIIEEWHLKFDLCERSLQCKMIARLSKRHTHTQT